MSFLVNLSVKSPRRSQDRSIVFEAKAGYFYPGLGGEEPGACTARTRTPGVTGTVHTPRGRGCTHPVAHSHVRRGPNRPPGGEALPAGADRGHGWQVNARIKPKMVVNANTSARTADYHACSTVAAASMRREDAADAAHAMSRRQRPDAVAARMNSTRSVRRSVSTVIKLAAIGLLGGADAQSDRTYCTQVNDQVSPKDATKGNTRMKAHTDERWSPLPPRTQPSAL